MTFDEILTWIVELLQRQGRVSYGALRRRFDLDEDYLQDVKDELIDAQQLAIDEGGKILVWTGGTEEAPSSRPPDSRPRTPDSRPIRYTPQHLAERIRAEQAAIESRGAANGERKTITALFADLKGSTALIEGLDPEDARAIIDPALQLMMDAVHRYDGYVAQAPSY